MDVIFFLLFLDPSGEQATFPPSALVSHVDEDGNDIFIYNDGHQKEEAFTGAGEETEDVDNSLCPTPGSQSISSNYVFINFWV